MTAIWRNCALGLHQLIQRPRQLIQFFAKVYFCCLLWVKCISLHKMLVTWALDPSHTASEILPCHCIRVATHSSCYRCCRMTSYVSSVMIIFFIAMAVVVGPTKRLGSTTPPRVCIAPFGLTQSISGDPIRLSDLEPFYGSLVANRASACTQHACMRDVAAA